ncbi:MAG: hypothetical protein ACPG5U_10325 [Planktomarina sp.]
MDKFEYKVVPAPTKGKRSKWIRGAATRFADRLEQVFNEMGAEGWEYVRTDTLPNEERKGLSNVVVTYRNLLVFRKMIIDPALQQARQLVLDDKVHRPVALLEAPAEDPKPASTPPKQLGGTDNFEDDLNDRPTFDPDDIEDAEELIEADHLQSLPENLSEDTVQLDDLAVKDADTGGAAGPINVALAKRANRG